MDFRESVASGVPEDPTPGPEALRGDIVDELNDHLSCAMQRELRRTDDESEAAKVVLKRFGDPRKVARQLWWDAVKEKVMRDRILLAAVAVVTLASLVVSVAALRAVQQGQEVNQAVLATVQKIANPSPAPPIMGDWAKLKVVAIEEGPERRRLKDVDLRLSGNLLNNGKTSEIRLKTNSEGTAPFGSIRPGVHSLYVLLPGGCATNMDTPALYPGTEQDFEVICPRTPPEKGMATFKLAWPEGFDASPYVLGIGLSYGKRKIADRNWSVGPSSEVEVDSQGAILATEAARGLVKDHIIIDTSQSPQANVSLAVGSYQVERITVYVVAKTDNDGRAIHFRDIFKYQVSFEIVKDEITEIVLPELGERIKKAAETRGRDQRLGEMRRQRPTDLKKQTSNP